MLETELVLADNIAFSSNLKDDVWHAQTDPKAYEWWYFDALSDNGQTALTIIFFENFIFSPRYNSASNTKKVPALLFSYFEAGKPLYQLIKEFSPEDFLSDQEKIFCQIQGNSFTYDSAPYGNGYLLNINLDLPNETKLEAQLEWLLVESNFLENYQPKTENIHYWNLVAPRADVTGHININNQKGKIIDSIHFRGTGYHDHKSDNRNFSSAISYLQWGRVHFADTTAVFYQLKENNNDKEINKLVVIKDNEFYERDAQFTQQMLIRDFYGLRYAKRSYLVSEDNMLLQMKPLKMLSSSFYHLRYLSEMTLSLRDGKIRKAIGITQSIDSKNLNYRWLDWLIDFRINKS